MPYVRRSVKERLGEHLQECSDARLKTRYLIVVNLIHHCSPKDTADPLGAARRAWHRVRTHVGPLPTPAHSRAMA
jgi:hypothetical protein